MNTFSISEMSVQNILLQNLEYLIGARDIRYIRYSLRNMK